MKIETTIQRIEILADYMETVPDEKFDFSHWGDENFKDGVTCGTTGCAIGHATTMPYFTKLGLHLTRHLGIVLPCYVNKKGEEERDLKGIQKVFGGSMALMRELFIPEVGPDSLTGRCTPQEWADQARKIVKRLREEHGIPEPTQQSQSSPQEQKSGQAGWRGLLETPRNLASDRLGGAPSKCTPTDQSACSGHRS